MIYVTHDQGEAMTLGSRIAIMQRARNRASRRPLELLPPAGQRVRRHVPRQPPMNLIEESRNGTRVQIWRATGGRRRGLDRGPGWDEARVVVVEPMGSETLVTLDYRTNVSSRACLPIPAFEPVHRVGSSCHPIDRGVRGRHGGADFLERVANYQAAFRSAGLRACQRPPGSLKAALRSILQRALRY